MKSSKIAVLVPESQMPAEGADVPSLAGDSTTSLLSLYSGLLSDSGIFFNISAEGKIQFSSQFIEENFLTMHLSGDDVLETKVWLGEGTAKVNLNSVADSVTGSIDAEDGMRRLVSRLAAEISKMVDEQSSKPVPLIRWKANDDSESEGGQGGVAQLLGVWLASDEQLEAMRSEGGNSLILEEAEVEGRGFRETLAALAILGVMIGGTANVDAGIFSRVFKKKAEKSESSQKKQAPIRVNKEALARTSTSRTHVIVDVSKQRAYLIADGVVVVDTPVSTAREGKYTPRGKFKITQRVESGKTSSIYGCELPFWMRLDDSPIGLHIGDLPGYPASAGCVRLPAEIAPVLFDLTKSGTTVSIVDSWEPDLLVASN